MAINIRRFDPKDTVPGHENTIIEAPLLPDSMKAPFWHRVGSLVKNGTSMAGHAHPTDEIYIVLSGTGYVIVGGENHPVKSGDTVVIPADKWHTMICTDKDETPLVWTALWWDKIDKESTIEGIHVHRFIKDKAELAHEDTILADVVVPYVMKTPFNHAYGYLEGNNSMELHKHPWDEFYIVYDGEGYVTVGDEQCDVKPGDVIEIPPNVLHTMTGKEGGTFLWAAFWWNPVE